MNIKDAKQIRIVEYLRIIGYSPVNVKGHQYWYLSPFRDEKTASFKVNDAINEWYDFGISAGGDLIDLGKLLYRTDSISLVLLRISENALSVHVCRLQHRNARPCPIEDDMQNLRIECLSQLALLSYLRSRYIDEAIGKQYCKEAHYDLHKIKYKYWDIYRTHEEKYQGNIQIIGCPFREGLNQLWRNQLLGFALQETGVYKNTTFSVCHHAKNRMLNQSILRYKELTCRNKMFNSFTNYDVLNAVNDVKSDLHSWLNWYKDVYCF